MAGPRLDSRGVRRAIDEGKLPSVWFWGGPESYLKNDLFNRLVAKAVDPSLVALNVSRFRAGEDRADEVVAVAGSFPMLGERRVVFYRDLDRIGVKDRDRLLAYASSPSPQTVLVLAGEWGEDRRGSADEQALARALQNAGAAIAVFPAPTDDQKRDWIRIRLREAGKECAEPVADAFLEACRAAEDRSPPLWAIAPELEKVLLTVGDRPEVTGEDLRVIGRKADEEQLQEVERQMSERNLAAALRALDGALLFRDNNEVRVVARLAYLFARKVRSRDPRYRPEEAARALRLLARVDRDLKSSAGDRRVALERTLAAICRG